MKRYLFSLFFFLVLWSSAIPAFAQPAERSAPFDKSAESLGVEEFSGDLSPLFSTSEELLHKLDSYSATDRRYEFEQILSLSEFGQSHLALAQNILRDAIENEPAVSIKRAEALLLSALELLSAPLQRSENINEAGKRLTEIPLDAFIHEPMLDGEYHFWLAEILRSEHDINGAIESYSSALEKNPAAGFAELVRFRRAELYEHELRYIVASQEFDTLASNRNTLSLYASLRRASLLRSMGKYEYLIAECSRASFLASDIEHLVIPSEVRNLRYQSQFALLRQDPSLRSERIFSAVAPKVDRKDTIILASRYTAEEIMLLRGSAFSGLKQYDSGQYYFSSGETSLQSKDSGGGDRERQYLAHAIKFERAWVELSNGENDEAARMFFSLAEEDTVQRKNPLFNGGTEDNTGVFYHDEKIPITATENAFSNSTGLSFIYDDYPARARFYAGIALSRAGKATQARDVLTSLSQDPSAIYADKARYHLALVEFKSNRMLQAEGLLAPIALRRSQSGVFASILLGDIHYRRSSFAKAAEYFASALGNLSDNDSALRSTAALERGLSLLPLGSWNESAQDLKLYVSLAPPGSEGLDEALFWLGRAYLRSDSILEARNSFKRVLDEFPKTSRLIDAQYGYAWTLFRNGQYRDADKEFAKVIEMDSITRYAYDALSRRGDALYAGGDLKKALAVYNLAVDRPTFNEYRTTRSLYQLGVIRMRSDSARSAMNAFRTIMTKFPKSDILDRAYYNYALAGFAIKQDEKANEAIFMLAMKFKDSPLATKGLYLAASNAEHNGNLQSAYTGYKKIFKEHPYSEEFVPSLFGAINALTKLKKYEDAVALADSFFIKAPKSFYAPRLLYRKGEIELLASNAKKSEKVFEEFGERFPADTLFPMSRYMLGKAVSGSDKGKAYGIYKDVTETYQHSDAAPYAFLAMARIDRNDKGNNANSAASYTKAYDMEYYSSEAAPQAMFEYANYLKTDLSDPDSALHIYDELIRRYLLETTIGGRSQLEASEILLASAKKNEAISRLEKLAKAQEGYELAAESRLRLAQLFRRDGSTKKALAEFEMAREDNSTTKDQLARSYIGSAECQIASGNRKAAKQLLAELLVTRGIPKSRRDAASQLLESITPKKKKKSR